MTMSSNASQPCWRPVRTSLAFQIATFTLWYWRFDAQADCRHFIELPPDTALGSVPLSMERDQAFCYLLPSHPVASRPPAISHTSNRLIYTPKTFPNHFVDLTLDGGFEGYLQRFSSKSRSTLKRKVRKFAEASPSGTLDWRVYRSADEMADFLPIATALSARTYQARILDVGLPDEQRFRDEAIARARNGKAVGFVLFLGENAAAYVYCDINRGVASYSYVGHDPALNTLSPGTVLQYKILEHLFPDPDVRVFDFTEGEGEHKAFFATGSALCAKSFVLPKRFDTLLLVRTHMLLGGANSLLDRMLERLSLRQRLRRLIRRQRGASAVE